MKKFLLTLTLILPLFGWSQSYISLMINPRGSFWTGVGFDAAPPPDASSWMIYVQSGPDTIINGLKYTAMTNSVSYYLREDTTSGKVFVKKLLTDSTEYLLFDFSMQVGDSIFDSLTNYNVKVVYVDSFQSSIGNLKRLQLQGSLYATWIEGIGSYQLLNPFTFVHFEEGNCLQRMINGGQLLYTDTNCKLYPTDIQDISAKATNIYPVPTHDVINIHFPSTNVFDEGGSIQIQNMMGQNIIARSLQGYSGDDISINLGKIPAGIYIATLTGGYGSSKLLGKFVVLK